MRYWFSVTPLVIVIAALAFLFSPILVLVAMTLVAIGVLAAIVAVPYQLYARHVSRKSLGISSP